MFSTKMKLLLNAIHDDDLYFILFNMYFPLTLFLWQILDYCNLVRNTYKQNVNKRKSYSILLHTYIYQTK